MTIPTKTVDVEALTREIRKRVENLSTRDTNAIRNLRREFSKRLVNAEPELVLQLALKLKELPEFEFRFIGYELVQNHRAAFASLDATSLEKLGGGLDSWVAVDCFSSYLAGPAWQEQQISNGVVRRGARSKDRWWRRVALVATVPLNNKTRGGTGDPARTLDICRMLLADRDQMVVKAMSWALRELAKRNEEPVRDFVEREREQLAPQVLREVNHKLTTGLKNPRKSRHLTTGTK
jgi:3-methyladenine DNA glycosylase AlkD